MDTIQLLTDEDTLSQEVAEVFFGKANCGLPLQRTTKDIVRTHYPLSRGHALDIHIAKSTDNDLPYGDDILLMKKLLNMAVEDRSRTMIWHCTLSFAQAFDMEFETASPVLSSLQRLACATTPIRCHHGAEGMVDRFFLSLADAWRFPRIDVLEQALLDADDWTKEPEHKLYYIEINRNTFDLYFKYLRRDH